MAADPLATCVAKEWAPDDVFEVLGSELAREIVVLASHEPHSAEELAERTDASLPTIYRRVEALQRYDLLEASVRIDEDGNKYRLFETTLQRVCFEVDDGGFEVDIELRRDMVDKFDALWDDLEGDDGDEGP